MPRSTPYDVAFGPSAEERFSRIRASLAEGRRDPHDQDAFVLDREVISYLRDLVPEEGVGEAIEQHLALLHHAYLYWAEGGWLLRPTRQRTLRLLVTEPASSAVASQAGDAVANAGAEPAVAPREPDPSAAPRAYYVQFPERLLWAELGAGQPHEPLDGLFVRPWPTGGYFVLGVFGMHPDRDGFTVVDLDGFPEREFTREDGSAPFAPVLPGGAAASLHSLVGAEELLELAARTVPLAVEARSCAGDHHRAHEAVELG